MQSVADGGIEYKIVRLQSSKDNVTYSIHAYPTSFSLSGIQRDGLLNHLGFHPGSCAFFPQGKCLAAPIPSDFPLSDFAKSFSQAYTILHDAERQLQDCGFQIDQSSSASSYGDGHTASQSKEMKRSEDDHFTFVMSWIEGGTDKGWCFHYRPKHPPLTAQLQAVFSFLELKPFRECPYFDFEQCHYRFFTYQKRGSSIMDSNAEYVHSRFDKHREKFSVGIENLLKIHSLLQPFNMYFLPDLRPKQTSDSNKRPTPQHMIENRGVFKKQIYDYDVAISFAGTERAIAEQLASIVRDAGFKVFYDDFYPEQLWGKDLPVFFDEIYRKQSRYCVIFISQEYNSRLWTNHERKSAQARAIETRGKEYILPIKVDESELPGLQPTIGYVSLKDYSIEKIAELLITKLKS